MADLFTVSSKQQASRLRPAAATADTDRHAQACDGGWLGSLAAVRCMASLVSTACRCARSRSACAAAARRCISSAAASASLLGPKNCREVRAERRTDGAAPAGGGGGELQRKVAPAPEPDSACSAAATAAPAPDAAAAATLAAASAVAVLMAACLIASCSSLISCSSWPLTLSTSCCFRRATTSS